jgi:hypothetical protein
MNPSIRRSLLEDFGSKRRRTGLAGSPRDARQSRATRLKMPPAWKVALGCLVFRALLAGQGLAGAETNAVPATNPPPAKVVEVAGRLALGNQISVKIDRLADWAGGADHAPGMLVPYLNGVPLRGLYPEEVSLGASRLVYHLRVTPANQEAWDDLLRKPSLLRPVTFTVGLEQDSSPFQSLFDRKDKIALEIIPSPWGLISLAVIVVFAAVFLWLARGTDVIRDAEGPANGGPKPYNLGRAQMALWLFLILGSYVVIWLITGNLDTITGSLLGLMGISASTALGDVMIDANKTATQTAQNQALAAEQTTVRSRIAEIQEQLAPAKASGGSVNPASDPMALRAELGAKQTRLGQINQSLQAAAATANTGGSLGFLRDVLSDSNGYSLHRFQIFVWTIALGVIFIASVYNNLKMPEFSSNLLALMGISAGTYIGFKFPEK